MTQDEIIKLIEANGLNLHGDIEHFAHLVAAQEPVGQVTEVSERGFKCEFSQRLAAGTKLYAAAPKENT